ncbi:hypothetical protein [Planococcus rifietoensis]|uniref:hypothetical protein n=1 Tax=Planococcus rifietoensis TaxID=200991 RepID=UPI00384E3D89
MKNDNEILLLFMYESGFTEEDMWDESIIESTRHSIAFWAYKFKRLTERAFNNLFNAIKNVVSNIWDGIKKNLFCEDNIFNEPSYKTNTIPKIDFNMRPLISDQVTDRKPKHKVKKIIR